jgi:hypothetical protein
MVEDFLWAIPENGRENSCCSCTDSMKSMPNNKKAPIAETFGNSDPVRIQT